jgi:hypothetical protein
MDLHGGTPGSPRDENAPASADPDSRTQSGNRSSSADTYRESLRPKSAEVVPIRAAAPSSPEDEAEPEEAPLPIWMQRTNVVMKFLICVWLGMVISVLPWTPAWTDNGLMMSLPKFRALASMNFVRGIVTGIGLIDIWIGIWEAVHYRDQRPATKLVTK